VGRFLCQFFRSVSFVQPIANTTSSQGVEFMVGADASSSDLALTFEADGCALGFDRDGLKAKIARDQRCVQTSRAVAITFSMESGSAEVGGDTLLVQLAGPISGTQSGQSVTGRFDANYQCVRQ
jgi:hypothetical protein